ncbi:MAG: hypothetical protein CM15mP66_10850 [Pseudomonadota bacterium]|nr:MAG: hypothetical protein CM15mP66_10850 [Pseudomonadota bacterium]
MTLKDWLERHLIRDSDFNWKDLFKEDPPVSFPGIDLSALEDLLINLISFRASRLPVSQYFRFCWVPEIHFPLCSNFTILLNLMLLSITNHSIFLLRRLQNCSAFLDEVTIFPGD